MTSPSSRRSVSRRRSGPARRSPRSRTTSGQTPDHATDVAAAANGADALVDAAIGGDRRALARILTAVENRTPTAEAALRRLYPIAGRAHLVGITGPPGAGKSTLVAALIGAARAAGRAVAVI